MRCYCLFVHDKSVSNDDDGDGDEKGKYLLAMLLLQKNLLFFFFFDKVFSKRFSEFIGVLLFYFWYFRYFYGISTWTGYYLSSI